MSPQREIRRHREVRELRGVRRALDVRRLWTVLAAVLMVAAAGREVNAAVPGTIAFQGYLTDQAGVPVSGPANLDFAIYAGPSGGAALWGETQAPVSVSEGVFAVALGAVTPLPARLFEAGSR